MYPFNTWTHAAPSLWSNERVCVCVPELVREGACYVVRTPSTVIADSSTNHRSRCTKGHTNTSAHAAKKSQQIRHNLCVRVCAHVRQHHHHAAATRHHQPDCQPPVECVKRYITIVSICVLQYCSSAREPHVCSHISASLYAHINIYTVYGNYAVFAL